MFIKKHCSWFIDRKLNFKTMLQLPFSDGTSSLWDWMEGWNAFAKQYVFDFKLTTMSFGIHGIFSAFELEMLSVRTYLEYRNVISSTFRFDWGCKGWAVLLPDLTAAIDAVVTKHYPQEFESKKQHAFICVRHSPFIFQLQITCRPTLGSQKRDRTPEEEFRNF